MKCQHDSMRCWGLFAVGPEPMTIPLKSLDINVQIVHNTARVFYTQVYQNESNKYLETEFFFPISPDACFDSFEAKFQDHIIKGVIKKKEQAKEEYKEAIAQGRTAAYSEINEETSDIMKVMIGNIPPKNDISIEYSYIQKLETSLNKFWCYRLFSTITPRYNSNFSQLTQQDIKLLSNYPLVSSKSTQAYPWTIKVEIQSPSPISVLQSPTHQIVTEYGNENHTCTINLAPGSPHHPNKDFVILYSNGKEDEKVDSVITPFEQGYCAMVSVMADFEKTSATEAYDNFVKEKVVKTEHAMKTVRGEYIFLIDRSGSMGGDRIEMAKTSLNLFLKSLPMDSYCNVVSFGSRYSFLHETSVASSPESLQNLVTEVSSFTANMGGTEIYSALAQVFNQPQKNGYPRFVFLLTDGAVSNTQQVLELIKRNSDKSRVFTIGVGNGCSPELITKGALYGMGKHQFVTENKTIFEKVIDLLNASLSPCYSEFSLEGENFDAMVTGISPNPTSIPFLISGQTVTFFLLLREGIFDNDSQKMEFKLKMYDTRIGSFRTIPFSLNKEDVLQNDLIPKLAVHDMMRRLEEESQNKDNLLWLDQQKDIKKTLLEFSLNYGVLCKETAFFCDVKENGKTIKSTEQAKIVVPALASADYTDDNIRRLKTKKSSGNKITFSKNLRMDSAPGGGRGMMLSEAMPEKKGSGGFLGGIVSSLSNAFSRKSVQREAQMPPPQLRSECINDALDIEEESVMQLQKSKKKKELDSRPIQTTKNDTYLEIIMKQNFEGSWSPTDQQIVKTVLKDGKLSEVPQEIQAKTQANLELIWMTVLVLVWLETNWKSEEGAWSLIYKKGVEWLKNQGINYDEFTDIGKFFIK